MTPERMEQLANEAAEEFDQLCLDRMERGAQKYGPAKFLTVDTLEEALYELSDLANYAKMTFMRIRLLQARLSEMNDAILTEDFSKDLES